MRVSAPYLVDDMNFLSSDDFSRSAFEKVLETGHALETGSEELALKSNSVLVLYFEKPSTRTRLSFEAAMVHLGGSSIYLDPNTTQRSRGETLADTTKMLSRYADFIAARLYSHDDLLEIAHNSQMPVINALTDIEHPTQALADVYTILKYKKRIKGIRIAVVGDIASNTTNSLMLTAAKLGAEISLVGPKEYPPNSKYVSKAMEYSKVVVSNSLPEGLENSDIIYTDTFVSMGQESEAKKRKEAFAPYQVNSKAVSMAKDTVMVMHCLPAHRGEEITDDVIDGPRSIVWDQAKNKLLMNKALLLYLSEQA